MNKTLARLSIFVSIGLAISVGSSSCGKIIPRPQVRVSELMMKCANFLAQQPHDAPPYYGVIPVKQFSVAHFVNHQVTAILGRGSDADAEVPVFKLICVDQATYASANPGEIRISTGATGDAVTVTFRLQSLKHTHWKNSPPDSVFMVQTKPATPNTYPNPGAWPTGFSKVVTVTANASVKYEDLTFTMPYIRNNEYAYSLHADQKDSTSGQGIDTGIDPQIINH